MTSAKVCAAHDMTPAVSRASDMAAPNVTSAGASTAHVPARMSAPGVTNRSSMPTVPSSMSAAMLRVKRIREEHANARAQHGTQQQRETALTLTRTNPGRYAGLGLHK